MWPVWPVAVLVAVLLVLVLVLVLDWPLTHVVFVVFVVLGRLSTTTSCGPAESSVTTPSRHSWSAASAKACWWCSGVVERTPR